jgi:acetylornithine/succinyldiaminopimelate/putrescine aminotransferase
MEPKLHPNAVFQPFLPNTEHISPSGYPVRFGYLDDMQRAFEVDGANIAAIIVEPIQGASG